MLHEVSRNMEVFSSEGYSIRRLQQAADKGEKWLCEFLQDFQEHISSTGEALSTFVVQEILNLTLQSTKRLEFAAATQYIWFLHMGLNSYVELSLLLEEVNITLLLEVLQLLENRSSTAANYRSVIFQKDLTFFFVALLLENECIETFIPFLGETVAAFCASLITIALNNSLEARFLAENVSNSGLNKRECLFRGDSHVKAAKNSIELLLAVLRDFKFPREVLNLLDDCEETCLLVDEMMHACDSDLQLSLSEFFYFASRCEGNKSPFKSLDIYRQKIPQDSDFMSLESFSESDVLIKMSSTNLLRNENRIFYIASCTVQAMINGLPVFNGKLHGNIFINRYTVKFYCEKDDSKLEIPYYCITKVLDAPKACLQLQISEKVHEDAVYADGLFSRLNEYSFDGNLLFTFSLRTQGQKQSLKEYFDCVVGFGTLEDLSNDMFRISPSDEHTTNCDMGITKGLSDDLIEMPLPHSKTRSSIASTKKYVEQCALKHVSFATTKSIMMSSITREIPMTQDTCDSVIISTSSQQNLRIGSSDSENIFSIQKGPQLQHSSQPENNETQSASLIADERLNVSESDKCTNNGSNEVQTSSALGSSGPNEMDNHLLVDICRDNTTPKADIDSTAKAPTNNLQSTEKSPLGDQIQPCVYFEAKQVGEAAETQCLSGSTSQPKNIEGDIPDEAERCSAGGERPQAANESGVKVQSSPNAVGSSPHPHELSTVYPADTDTTWHPTQHITQSGTKRSANKSLLDSCKALTIESQPLKKRHCDKLKYWYPRSITSGLRAVSESSSTTHITGENIPEMTQPMRDLHNLFRLHWKQQRDLIKKNYKDAIEEILKRRNSLEKTLLRDQLNWQNLFNESIQEFNLLARRRKMETSVDPAVL